MIKVIIFDWGGVVSEEARFDKFYKRFGPEWNLDPEKMRKISRRQWLLARVNKIPSNEYWKGCAKDFGVKKDIFRKEFLDYMGFNPATLELAKKLKKNYKLGLLSNQIEDWLEEKIKEQGLNEVFDIIITSYNTGYAKPDPNIYRVALERFDIKPEECIFIDDRELYLKPARKMGINTIQFKNVEQVKTNLVSLGITV